MTLVHLHLLLNHVPTIGMGLGMCMFLFALFSKSRELQRASLVLFLAVAMLTIPTYVTGNSAEERLNREPSVSKALIHTHESAAFEALILMMFTGAAAWVVLWRFRRTGSFSSAGLGSVLILSLITMALVARAANIGGEIRHSELRSAVEPTLSEGNIARAVGSFVTGQRWVWPTSETLHFIGLSVLMGVVLIVNLRMLGLMKGLRFTVLHRLLPWGMLGFAVNTLTGMLFFVAAPNQYDQNPVFHWKMAFLMLAAIETVYFTIFDHPWQLEAEQEAPFSTKVLAIGAIIAWIGVTYCGRMLPFLGEAF